MRSRRTTWLASGLLVLALALFVAAMVLYVANAQLATPGPWTLVSFFLFTPIGVMIVMLRPQQLIGWLFCGIGVFYTLWAALEEYARFALITHTGDLPGGTWAAAAQLPVGPISWMLLIYSLMVFPTGRHLSARWQLVARCVVAMYILISLLELLTFPLLEPFSVSNPLSLVSTESFANVIVTARNYVGIAFVFAFAASLTTRFRRATGDERQQLKWLTYVAVLWVLVSLAAVLSNLLFPPEIQVAISGVPIVIAITAIPVAVALAILRYRLYDIDLLIRRTLVYSALTVLLATIYWAGIAFLQTALRPVIGEGNDLAIVATTLAVAALFLPLRQRIQGFIDRRFYRRKYNVAITLAAFGQVARDEVDLSLLTHKLIGVVEETLQPEHASLWLREVRDSGQKLNHE
jgi:hypothetical protein